MKDCHWCKNYNDCDADKYQRPEDEVGNIDEDGFWICDACVEEARVFDGYKPENLTNPRIDRDN